MIYLFPLILILTGVFNFDYRGLQRGKLLLWAIICISLIFIAGFRFRIGVDTVQYMNYYDHINNLHNLGPIDFQKTRYAPGYVIFASLCKSLTDEILLMQIIVATFLNISVFIFFWRNTNHCFFAAFLYLFFLYFALNMEVMRESIAVGFFLFAWPCLKVGKLFRYYILVIIATLFHISAVVLLLLPVIFLPGIRSIFTFGMRTWYIGALVLLMGFTLRYFLFDFIQLISINDKMTELANKYAQNDLGGLKTLNIFGILNTIFIYVVYPCIALSFLKKYQIGNQSGSYTGTRIQYFNKIEILCVLSIYISLLSVSVIILGRFNNYFMFFSYLIVSDWIFSDLKFSHKKVRLRFGNWAIIFLPLFLFSIYSYYFSNVNRDGSLKTYMKYFPYASVFDRDLDPDREKVYRYISNREI